MSAMNTIAQPSKLVPSSAQQRVATRFRASHTGRSSICRRGRSRLHVSSGVPLHSVKELADQIKTGERSAVDVTTEYIERMAAAEPKVQSFISSNAELALEAAAKVDADVASGAPLGPLAGVPIGVKDNLAAVGGPTTAGSHALKDYHAPYDATAVTNLREAGAIILGKTNMDEFGMGSTTETSAYQVTRNPWDLSRVPGGSSGGSAAAVAAGQVAAALGSDTGGSIRQPAAFCGLVGVKPTYGRVSRHGLVAYASSFDVVGPLTHTVEDAALLLQTIAGQDPRDATSAARAVPDYIAALPSPAALAEHPLKGTRVGVVEETLGEGIDPEVKAATQAAAAQLESLGAEVVPVSLPSFQLSLPAYYVIAVSEASSNLSRYDGVRYGPSERSGDLEHMYTHTRQQGLGEEVKRRILMGTYTLSAGFYDAYYKQAQQVRELVLAELSAALAECTCLLTPATPAPAYPLQTAVNDPLEMFIGDLCTVAVNLAGVPAVVLPAGRTAAAEGRAGGLPLGVQLIGKHFDEAALLRVARAYEASSDWRLATSPLAL